MDLRNNLHVQNIAKILHTVGEFVEGNMICDINAGNYAIDRNMAKITNIQKLATGKAKICEIGVNAGHSLLLMLMVNPTAAYTLFDLGYHKYTAPCIEYLQKAFPSATIEIIYGNSVETVAKHEGLYDLVHIDGGHEPEIFEHDYNNVKRLAKDLIIFDDYDLPAIRSFLEAKLKAGEIEPVEESPTDRHLIYRYIQMDLRHNVHVQNITKILYSIGGDVEGNLVCIGYGDHYTIDYNMAKITNLQKLATGKAKICEIGVNAGHSLLIMLLVNPTAEYTLFDLGAHTYTAPCIDYLQKAFPSAKIQIIYGNSVDTVAKHEGSYDLVHIDGGHEEDVFVRDYENVKRLAKDLVIFDDYDYPKIRSFLNYMIAAEEIEPVEETPTSLHLIYRYT